MAVSYHSIKEIELSGGVKLMNIQHTVPETSPLLYHKPAAHHSSLSLNAMSCKSLHPHTLMITDRLMDKSSHGIHDVNGT